MFLITRMATLQYFKEHDGAFDPILPYPNYPGCELRSALDYSVKPGQRILLRTDIIVKLNAGYYGKISPRPVGHGTGLSVLKMYIEPNKATSIQVTVLNSSDVDVCVKRGQIIALLIVCKIEVPLIVQRATLAELKDSRPCLPLVEICKTSPHAFLPIEVDGGYVLKSLCFYEIPAGCREIVSCGIAFKFPEGYYGSIEPTDAQTWLWKITILGGDVLNCTKKEVRFIVGNTGTSTYKICPGDKIGILRLKKLYPHMTVVRCKEEMGIVDDVEEEVPKKIMKVNSGLNFKIMIVLRSTVPDSSITESFFKTLKSFVDDMFKNVRFDPYDSNKLFTHCRKEFNDRCVTFYLSLYGDVLAALQFSEDYLVESIEGKLKEAADSLSLTCFVKVVPVKGDEF